RPLQERHDHKSHPTRGCHDPRRRVRRKVQQVKRDREHRESGIKGVLTQGKEGMKQDTGNDSQPTGTGNKQKAKDQCLDNERAVYTCVIHGHVVEYTEKNRQLIPKRLGATHLWVEEITVDLMPYTKYIHDGEKRSSHRHDIPEEPAKAIARKPMAQPTHQQRQQPEVLDNRV